MRIPNKFSPVKYDVIIKLKDGTSESMRNVFMYKEDSSKYLIIKLPNDETTAVYNIDYIIQIIFKLHKES